MTILEELTYKKSTLSDSDISTHIRKYRSLYDSKMKSDTVLKFFDDGQPIGFISWGL